MLPERSQNPLLQKLSYLQIRRTTELDTPTLSPLTPSSHQLHLKHLPLRYQMAHLLYNLVLLTLSTRIPTPWLPHTRSVLPHVPSPQYLMPVHP